MALFSELPVYKLGYDLLISIYQRTSKFTREYKYTMGERLKNETLSPLRKVGHINFHKNRQYQTCIPMADKFAAKKTRNYLI